MDKISLLIVDDHEILRQGLKALIQSNERFILVGEASNGYEAIEIANTKKPDVVLIDLVMPGLGGIETIAKIKLDNPKIKILVLTNFADDDKVFPAIKAGALGYLLKDTSPTDLIRAIQDVYSGKPSLHPIIALMLIEEINQPSELPLTKRPLTEREEAVLKLIAQGMSNQEIAEYLVISEFTVRTHVSNILAKLHLANRIQATLYAIKSGIADVK